MEHTPWLLQPFLLTLETPELRKMDFITVGHDTPNQVYWNKITTSLYSCQKGKNIYPYMLAFTKVEQV